MKEPIGPRAGEPPAGLIEDALRARFPKRETLLTFGEHVPFDVEVASSGVALYLGENQTRTNLPWPCLEGARPFLASLVWVKVGGWNKTTGEPGTFDEYLKDHCSKTNGARWLAKVLAEARVVDALDERPLVIRLRQEFR